MDINSDVELVKKKSKPSNKEKLFDCLVSFIGLSLLYLVTFVMGVLIIRLLTVNGILC